ncbi:NAD(P)-binding protein [Chloroflexota bacterium]
MSKKNIYGPDPTLELTYLELPIGASTIGFDPDLLKTGTWRFIRPEIKTMLSPCNEACPAGVDVRGFIKLIEEGHQDKALELYMEENPFPAICGNVCFHPCEAACNRGSYDEQVSINALENSIGARTPAKPVCLKNNGKSVAIVGSGPAGMSCAYYLVRLGYTVKIFEKDDEPGGVLRYGIPEYRLPKKVLDREIKKLKAAGIAIETGKNLGQNISLADLDKYDASFIATGADVAAGLDVPGAKAEGVYSGLDFLKSVVTGNIKSFDKRVVIIGGGNTAIDVARTVLRLGGKPAVYYRRTEEEMPALRDEIEDLGEEGIELNCLTTPVGIQTAQNKVTDIEFVRNELGKVDETNRPSPVTVKGSNFKVNCDAVILAVGEAADLSPVLSAVKTDRQLIVINEAGQTSNKNIYAGGDATHIERTVVNAIGSGKRAAIGIDGYLSGISEKESLNRLEAISIGNKGSLSFNKYYHKDFTIADTDKQVINYEDLNTSYFHHANSIERRKIPVQERVASFEAVRKGLRAGEIRKEAGRCFSCGTCNACGNCFIFCPDSSVCLNESELISQIDYEYCKGCGICAEECPRGAIGILKEE